ncbi:SH3 domain-containing protein [Sulfitobacter sp.]|jgi:SH3-like domain-containing protein|uniref:SH3 domain-containing protein n=1 Tax=Sulfitobacter sp. TaxID=1903071 RepID=UPI00304C5903
MNKSKLRRLGAGLLGACALILTTSFATPVLAAGDEEIGKVTKRPIPRFVSMKASEGNVRRGPSLTHRIDWVFKRRDMPLRITAEHGHWRRVEDRDGMGGWVHYSLLSGTRTVLIEKDMLTLHARPDATAPVMAALEMGVVARVAECGGEWCLLRSGGFKGWAPKARLWGVRPQEVFD